MQRREAAGAVVALLAASLGAAGCTKGTSKAVPDGARTLRVGPAGGGLFVPTKGGSLRVDVPLGAIAGEVELTARPLPLKPGGAIGPAFELGPHGMTFAKPVSVSFEGVPAELVREIPPGRLSIATLGEKGWELLPTAMRGSGRFEASTAHFSTFALVGVCFASGTGDDFQLVGCPTGSPRVRTSVPKTLWVSGGLVSLTVSLLGESVQGSVAVTVEGLLPNTKYYLRHDATVPLAELTTSASGTLSFSRSRAENHVTVLTTVHGSLELTSSSCVPPVGVFTSATSTCALLQDIPDADVTLHEDGFTLDCRDPNSGRMHTIGSPGTRHGFGVSLFSLTGAAVRNCIIVNTDTAIAVDHSSASTIENVEASQAPFFGYGVRLFGTDDATVRRIRTHNVSSGLSAVGCSALDVASSEFVGGFSGVGLATTSATARNLLINALVGGVFVSGADAQLDSVAASTRFNNLGESSVTFGEAASGAVRNATLSGGNFGIHVEGTALAVTVTESTVSCTRSGGMALEGAGPYLIFHNNLFANQTVQLSSHLDGGFVQLWDTRPGSPTFQHGNYWGRQCPGPLVGPGDIQGDAGAADLFPFAARSGWEVGSAPGCPAGATPAPPRLFAPVEDGLVRTAMPAFSGAGTPGATAELLYQGATVGTATVSGCGLFTAYAASPFSDGPHVVTARLVVGGVASAASAPRYFVVDTGASGLAAPVILAPQTGATLGTATPLVSGTAPAGSTVQLLENRVPLGASTASGSGQFSLALAGPLSDGPHTLTARATLAGAVSPESAPVSFVVDATGPSAPSIRFPTGGVSIADSTFTVLGAAEPQSVVEVREGAGIVSSAVASADGGFLVETTLASGPHTISATSRDAVGRVSAPSAAVAFTVAGVSSSSPLVGASSKVTVTSVTDRLDPFVPAQGEVNELSLKGVVTRAQGAAGKQAHQAVLERRLVSAATGQTVLAQTASMALGAPTSPGQQAQPFAMSTTWDGRTVSGTIAPEGTYLSVSTVSVTRNPRPGGSSYFPPDCTPTGPIDGPCTLDKISFTSTVWLLERPRGSIPVQPPPTLCSQRAEACDGKDNNCNGMVDEGACGSEVWCKCD